MKDITVQKNGLPSPASTELTLVKPQELAARRQVVQELMRTTMVEGVHYGTIGGGYGNKTKALYQPGTELLLNKFMIGVQPQVEDISPPGEVAYRVICRGVHLPTNQIIGEGIGEASSLEEKYAWRKAVSNAEFEHYPEDRRRIKFNAGYKGKPDYTTKQVRVEPQNIANTILKMAKKRAQTDLTKTGLGVSDMFADLDGQAPSPADNPPPPNDPYGYGNRGAGRILESARESRAGSGSDPNKPLQPGQKKMITSTAMNRGVDMLALFKHFGVQSVDQLYGGQVNEVLDWIRAQGGGK